MIRFTRRAFLAMSAFVTSCIGRLGRRKAVAIETPDRVRAMCSVAATAGGAGNFPFFLFASGFANSNAPAITLPITGVTNVSTPVVTTEFAHNLTTGQAVYIQNLTGSAGINNLLVYVTVLSATTFSCNNFGAPGAYGSGGIVTPIGQATNPLNGVVVQQSIHPATGLYFLALDQNLNMSGAVIANSATGTATVPNVYATLLLNAQALEVQAIDNTIPGASDAVSFTITLMRSPFTQGGQ